MQLWVTYFGSSLDTEASGLKLLYLLLFAWLLFESFEQPVTAA
jgi:hypothetical protein